MLFLHHENEMPKMMIKSHFYHLLFHRKKPSSKNPKADGKICYVQSGKIIIVSLQSFIYDNFE